MIRSTDRLRVDVVQVHILATECDGLAAVHAQPIEELASFRDLLIPRMRVDDCP